MPKSIDAHEQPINKIFSDDYVFTIPGYQRPYAWKVEQAADLFEDLISFMRDSNGNVADMPPYFLGSIVLIKDENSPSSEVVDGQQRLTTLTILLSAIRSSLPPGQSSDFTRFIYEKANIALGNSDRFRLTLRERDAEFFRESIQREGELHDSIEGCHPENDSQRSVLENAGFFLRKLSELSTEERLQFAQFIIQRCYLVVVATPDLDSAYRIFSVLNSRGLDLSPTDILKAQITGQIREPERGTLTKKWEEAEELLGRDSFVDLFSHIRMVYRRSKPKGTLIKEFKEHVLSTATPEAVINKILIPMGQAYSEILNESFAGTSSAEEINEHLKWLNRLEFTDWVPPALAFYSQFRQNSPALLSFLADLERLAYSLLIRRAGINERIDRFSRLTTAITSNDSLVGESSPLQLSREELKQITDLLDGEFYEIFSARARSAILLRLDTLVSGGGATYDYEVVTVEHVLPQNPQEGSEWLKWFPDPAERKSLVNRLGNLALLTRKKNSAASNFDFEKKKTAYFERKGTSPFPLTTQVIKKKEWTPDVIKNRQVALLKILTEHWRLSQ